MKADKRNRRKIYFIDRGFQFSFIMKFCALIIIASLATGFLIYYFNQRSTTVAFENSKVVVKSTANFIFPIIIQILIIVTLLVGIGTVLVTLLTSHKIAGPLYRLRKDLERVKDGDVSFDIRIRAGDQLKEAIREANEVRLGLKSSIGKMKKNWNYIKPALPKLQSGTREEEEKKRLESSIKAIDAELARFKTE